MHKFLTRPCTLNALYNLLTPF